MPAASVIRHEPRRLPLGDQLIYPNIHFDDAGRPLCGDGRYLLHFEREPASLFWTVTLYAADMEVDRCDSVTPVRNADGSLTILIQDRQPALGGGNWLAAPDGGFTISMRFYGPHSSLLDGSWRMPLVVRVD